MSAHKQVLSGSARKLKDSAADWHNLCVKWERLNDDGCTTGSDIVNMTHRKRSAGKAVDSAQPEITVDIDKELETKCDALVDIVVRMGRIVCKMETILSNIRGVCALQRFQQGEGVRETLPFHTWPLSYFEEVSSQLCESYRRELALKRVIVREIAHNGEPDLSMTYLSSWLYQPYLEDNNKLMLEAMLVETGHRSL